jgi:glycosyltransferase involved in cell wall biosynthesis
MSLKIPAIITNIPSNREFADDKIETVVVVPIKDEKAIADAILDLYHNPEKRKAIGENGYNHIRTKLNNERTVLEMKKLYEELVSE